MADLIETTEELESLLRLVSEEAEAAVVRDRLLRPWLIVENIYGEFFAYSYPTEGEVAGRERAEDLLTPLDVLHRPGKTVDADE